MINLLESPVLLLGRLSIHILTSLGSLSLFGMRMLRYLLQFQFQRSTMLVNMYHIGVQSIPVVMITGTFIGMVLAVQSYAQFRFNAYGIASGCRHQYALVTELGPVLAATMLAGRVGSSMAAELGTMRVTEQIDALRALGANPIQYLVVPRFLACFTLIPLLTVIADAMGMFGGWFFSTQLLDVSSADYWHYSYNYLRAYDILGGILKSVFFGAAIAIISCQRGFHCGNGAEGVGKAATESFVYSFVAILAIDFFLGILITETYYIIWPHGPAI